MKDNDCDSRLKASDAPTTRECPRCGAVMGLLKPYDETDRRSNDDPSQKCQQMREAIRKVVGTIPYYLGIREELKRIAAIGEDAPTDECAVCGDDAPLDKVMRPVELDNSYSQRNNHYHCLNSHADAIVKIQQQINSHTAIVHGEIERRLSEMGQKIDIQRNEINAHQSQIDANRNSLQDLIANRTVDPVDVDHDAHAEAHRKMEQQIDRPEQRISEKEE